MKAMSRIFVLLATIGLCLPPAVFASGAEVKREPVVIDVALQEGGLLLGQVVNPQGAPLSKTAVSLQENGREIAVTQTNKQGYFAVRGLRGRVYQVVAAEAHGTFRTWNPGAAPPTSQHGALLVAGKQTVRGQCAQCEQGAEYAQCTGCGDPGCAGECAVPCRTGLAGWLTNPWIVAGIVATAVAVPVSIHNSGRPSSP